MVGTLSIYLELVMVGTLSIFDTLALIWLISSTLVCFDQDSTSFDANIALTFYMPMRLCCETALSSGTEVEFSANYNFSGHF